MKPTTCLVFFALCFSFLGKAQITGPVIRAGFGVDADLRANFFNNFIQNGNDDWFSNNAGNGIFVIDTTGAAAILNGYISNPASRKYSFYRTMNYPQYTVVNNRLLIDAVFIRDYHGIDSTVFAFGSNKNGMNPSNWTTPVAQGIPDKNEILDMFVHIRRSGADNTDSLWMFGAVSIENTTGNRYFDFEMFQTDIYYDRPSQKFYNYGPDLGHTSWQFDASGNITVPGDIIFTAEFGTSALTLLEARIWVHQSALSMTPTAFNWGGQFDGGTPDAQFGYASILPKTGGVFYSGLQSINGTWAGPFELVRENETVVTTYTSKQFMEVSINLTKLGLDPVNLLGGNVCGMPFRRLMAKTRASTSFTAELKDFVAPTDLFIAPRVDMDAEVPFYCGESFVGTLHVSNPHASSVYTWSTSDGHIVGSNVGTEIFVDSPGTYTVSQALVSGCNTYASDSLTLIKDIFCYVLPARFHSFNGKYAEAENKVLLNWTVLNNESIYQFYIEKSTDGIHFTRAGLKNVNKGSPGIYSYNFTDVVSGTEQLPIYYRIKMMGDQNYFRYSQIIKVAPPVSAKEIMTVMPNPVKDILKIGLYSSAPVTAVIAIFNAAGKCVLKRKELVKQGYNIITIGETKEWIDGMYYLVAGINERVIRKKIMLIK